jgi:hypothetical protein
MRGWFQSSPATTKKHNVPAQPVSNDICVAHNNLEFVLLCVIVRRFVCSDEQLSKCAFDASMIVIRDIDDLLCRWSAWNCVAWSSFVERGIRFDESDAVEMRRNNLRRFSSSCHGRNTYGCDVTRVGTTHHFGNAFSSAMGLLYTEWCQLPKLVFLSGDTHKRT